MLICQHTHNRSPWTLRGKAADRPGRTMARRAKGGAVLSVVAESSRFASGRLSKKFSKSTAGADAVGGPQRGPGAHAQRRHRRDACARARGPVARALEVERKADVEVHEPGRHTERAAGLPATPSCLVGQTVGRSDGRSVGHSGGRAAGRMIGRLLGRTLGQSAGRSPSLAARWRGQEWGASSTRPAIGGQW